MGFTIYTPQEYPMQALILIISMTLVGIIGGIFVHPWFTIFSLLFWMQYTGVLAYMQYKRRSKHSGKGITTILLNPGLRFALFEILAVIGIAFVFLGKMYWAAVVLLGWMLFAMNFYFYYRRKP